MLGYIRGYIKGYIRTHWSHIRAILVIIKKKMENYYISGPTAKKTAHLTKTRAFRTGNARSFGVAIIIRHSATSTPGALNPMI